MIIAFANKRLDVSKEESEYLNSLKQLYGEDSFHGIFNTDENGLIIAVTPSMTKPIQMIILFSIMNIMLNQRLRKIDNSRIEQLEKRIQELESKSK